MISSNDNIHFSRLVNSDPCCSLLTSEPDQSYCGIIQVPYLLGVQKIWVFGSRYLVVFMTMTSLAGFWEEKRLEYIICSLTCIEYNFFTNLH